MRIFSTDFENNGQIPAQFTCDGEGISPELSFEGAPSSCLSMVLILDDPDAPRGTFTHWLIWNIAPTVTEIVQGETPADAVVGTNTAGKQDYVPPCPPSDTHHYIFKLIALDTTLNLDSSATQEELEGALDGHVLETAELTGLYIRKQ